MANVERILKAIKSEAERAREKLNQRVARQVVPVVDAWAKRHRLRVEYTDAMGVQWFTVTGRDRGWDVYFDEVDPNRSDRHPHHRYHTDNPHIRAFFNDLLLLLDMDAELDGAGLSLCGLQDLLDENPIDYRPAQTVRSTAL